MRRLTFLALLLPACVGTLDGGITGGGGNGGGGGGGGGGASPDAAAQARLDVAITPPTETGVELNSELAFQVNLTSVNGFAGDVTLSVPALPEGWLARFEPGTSIPVAANATVSGTVRITIPSDASAGDHDVSIKYESPLGTETTAPTPIAVANVVTDTVTINANDQCVYPLGDGGQPMIANNPRRIKLGTQYRIRNGGTQPMRIHADGGIPGLNHQPANMAPGQSYNVTPTNDGIDSWYCHTPNDAGPRPFLSVVR